MRKIRTSSQLLAVVLALALIFGFLPLQGLAADGLENGYNTEELLVLEEIPVPVDADYITVYVSFEGYNLGHGFYIEPTAVKVPVGSTGDIPTSVLLNQMGHEYSFMWGLDRIQNIHPGTSVNPPTYITITLGSGEGDGSLGSFDYSPYAGWMVTVNHEMLNVGIDSHEVVAGDVIRWQFSVEGWGADLGLCEDRGFWTDPLYDHADKTDLIRALFVDGISEEAKRFALSVIIDPLATEDEVAEAIAVLAGRPTGITVAAEGTPPATTVRVGTTLQFNAVITGMECVSQDVAWTVTGHIYATINQEGLLSVGADVPVNTELAIRATSTVVTAVYGEARVTTTAAATPPPGGGGSGSGGGGGGSGSGGAPVTDPSVTETPATEQPVTEPVTPSANMVFNDVRSENWFSEAVQFVFERNIMQGTSPSTFEPNAPLSRAMVVTVLYRMVGEPTVTYSSIFQDVPSGLWFSDAVVWGYNHGIVEGMGQGIFAPHENITREQFAVMMHRFAQFSGHTQPVPDNFSVAQFTDSDAVSSWAVDAMIWSVYNGIITGMTPTTLAPAGTTTRAECAVILMRYIQTFVEPAIEVQVDEEEADEDVDEETYDERNEN